MTRGRSILLALAAGVFLWIAFGVVSDRALAQCGNCKPPPTCNTCQVAPPPNCCKPAPPPPSNQTCCSPNHNIYVPGVNVYVAPSVVVNASINAAINLNNYNYNYNTNNNTNNNNQTNNNGGGGTPGTGGGDNSNTNIINNVITATSSSVSNASSVSNSTATGGAGGIGIGIGNGTGGNGTGGGTGAGGGGTTNVYAYGGNATAYGNGLGGSATAYAYGSAFSDSLGIGGGGGGGGGQMFFTPPMATGYIQGLTVEGPERRQKVAYEATRKTTRRVIIQAFCLDDRDVPHPASQLTPDREIGDHEGEIYRCIAGTRLQYVVAEYAGKVAFDGGQTVVCNKSDSLYYTPNGQGGGALSCRPQKPARDCNERSLLRRFGAGVKILTIVSAERYTAYREEMVREQSSTVQTALALDGGVGGVAF